MIGPMILEAGCRFMWLVLVCCMVPAFRGRRLCFDEAEMDIRAYDGQRWSAVSERLLLERWSTRRPFGRPVEDINSFASPTLSILSQTQDEISLGQELQRHYS